MAFSHFLPHVVILVLIGAAKGNSFVEVQCKTQTIGQYGHQSLLSCVIKTIEDIKDPEIHAVFWEKKDAEKPLLELNDGDFNVLSPHYSFAEPHWDNKNLNVSLLISNTGTEDEGVYTCNVYTNSGSNQGETSLKVTAKYSKPTFESYPENFNLDTGGSLTCESSGYPQGRLRWFDKDNKEWIINPKTEVENTENGLFRLSSTMTVMAQSSFSKYICKVFNNRGELEAENYYTVKDSPKTGSLDGSDASYVATKIVAPVVVIGSLIVGLLVWLVLMHRRRAQRELRAVPQNDYDEEELQEMKKVPEYSKV